MRLFSIIQWHHFAYMIISLALLGYGASGTFIALFRGRLLLHFNLVFLVNALGFAAAAIGCFAIAQTIAFNPEEVLWNPWQWLNLFTIYLVLSVPFFCAANCIGLALAAAPSRAPIIYAADLIGAGVGSVAIIGLLFILFPGDGLIGIALLALIASLPVWPTLGVKPIVWLPILVVSGCLLVLIPKHWIAPKPMPYKGLSQSLRAQGTRLIGEYSSPLGLISVIESPTIPLRHAPGLSLNATSTPPAQLGLFTDGDGLSVITQNYGQQSRYAYLDQLTSALPYHFAQPKRVLVLGAGGGADVLQARYHGVKSIDAVEINPQIVALVKQRYGGYSGNLYAPDNARIFVDDIRAYLAGNADKHDLIQVPLLDSFGGASGLFGLAESYIYTIEAVTEYLEHLSANGYLAVNRWVNIPPRDSLKLFATAVDALSSMGVSAPEKHLIMIRGLQTSTLVVKASVFGDRELAQVRDFCAERSFDLVYYPGMPIGESNRFNQLREPHFYRGTLALIGGQRIEYLDRYKFNLEPATDDRPYFFHFFKWRTLREILSLGAQGGYSLLESGYLVLIVTLLQALIAGLVLVVIPLYLRKDSANSDRLSSWRSSISVYFGALGLAFLAVEMAFIQKFTLFLQHPIYAVTVVLSAFLISAGIGSHFSAKLVARRGGRASVNLAIKLIILLGGIYLVFLGGLFDSLLWMPDFLRIFLSVVLIAPLGFFMGMPFPLALAGVAAQAPGSIPWAWAINGCASVVSAVASTLIAIQFGFSILLVFALTCYAIAALNFPRLAEQTSDRAV